MKPKKPKETKAARIRRLEQEVLRAVDVHFAAKTNDEHIWTYGDLRWRIHALREARAAK